MKKSNYFGKKYWLNLAKKWQLVKPPIRPSKEDLKIYEKLLKKNKIRNNILILGATPELRELALKYGKQIVVCDINLNMILAMTELMRHKNKKEIWIKADWVSVPLKHNHFDAILGDVINTNVGWEKINIFHKHLANILKPKGIFVTRSFFATSKERAIKIFEAIIKNITKKKKPTLKDLAHLKIALEILSYNPRKKIVTIGPKFYQKIYNTYIKKYKVSPKKRKLILSRLLKLYSLSKIDKSWRAPTENEDDKLLKRYFKIAEKIYSPDPFFKNLWPIYCLRKK